VQRPTLYRPERRLHMIAQFASRVKRVDGWLVALRASRLASGS
jgi:hypothetical protein